MCIGHDEALNYDSQVHFWGLKVCIQTCIHEHVWLLEGAVDSQLSFEQSKGV